MAGVRAIFSVPILLAAAAALAQGQPQEKPYPVPPSVWAEKNLGVGIQRTMTLLATSTPEHRNTVRILFYGQSITEQEWSKRVAEDLRRRFPNADLQIENRAIGGFASQLLIRPAEHDLYPYDPSRENAVTLAQGLANMRHRLEIVADGPGMPGIGAIRVYRPAVK